MVGELVHACFCPIERFDVPVQVYIVCGLAMAIVTDPALVSVLARAKMAMIAMTTNNSINVNPRWRLVSRCRFILKGQPLDIQESFRQPGGRNRNNAHRS
jgi:hypothetical protein